MRRLFVVAGVAALPWWPPTGQPRLALQGAAVVETYRGIAAYPHDPAPCTRELIDRDGFLFESTGLNGMSTLRKVRLETGRGVQQCRLDAVYFAEVRGDN